MVWTGLQGKRMQLTASHHTVETVQHTVQWIICIHTQKTPQLEIISIILQKKLSYESHDIHITFLAYKIVSI